MPCETVDLGNGQFAMVCGRGGRRHNCQFCSRYATKQCDFPVLRKGKMVTCDAWMCDRCAVKQEPLGSDLLDRDLRKVRAKIVPNVKRETLQAEIMKEVKYGTKVYTDDAVAYNDLRSRFVHEVVNKTESYVRGQVHVNGMENFWSLLKRGLSGTYVAVEPFHLERYIDEQIFRYNNRATKDNPLDDSDRFDLAVRQIVGKRLTYAALTGKTVEQRQ
jgi:hypothetical protein